MDPSLQIPYNVLNTSPLKPGVNISKSQAHKFLPYDIYSKIGATQSKEALEKEYNKIMGEQAQKSQENQEDKSQNKQNQSQSEQSNKTQDKQKKKSNIKAMINFDKLSAGTVSSSSGIFNGKNIQFGWSSHSKTNNGFGTLGGNHNNFHDNVNVVFDNDQIDTPIDDRDVMWSPIPTS